MGKKSWLADAPSSSRRNEPCGYRFRLYPRLWVEPDRREEFATVPTVRRCSWGWRRHVEAAAAAGTTLPADRYLEIWYEDLAARPEVMGWIIAKYAGVNKGNARDHLLTALAAARRSPVGRWTDELTGRDLEDVLEEAGRLLSRLGYR